MDHKTLSELNLGSSQKIIISRIQRIIEKYPEVWRVLHEPVQNSIDAIQKRADINTGEISIQISLSQHKVTIRDNGTGFPENMELLLPDGTDKEDQADTMGYQGVGLKSVVYSSRSFRLLSNLGNGKSWGIEISNASRYLDTGGKEDAPIRELDEQRDSQGTTVEIEFDKNIPIQAMEQIIDAITIGESNFKWPWERPDFLKSNFRLRQAKNESERLLYMLEYYLLTHTYIGSVSRLLNCRLEPMRDLYAKPISISLTIDFEGISQRVTDNQFLQQVINEIADRDQKTLDLTVENKFQDFQGIVERQKQTDPRSIPFGTIYSFDIPPGGIAKREQYITLKDEVYCKIMTPDYSKGDEDIEQKYRQYISLLESTRRNRRDANVRLFADLFPKILGIYILIGRMDYFEKYLGSNYGIKIIAANGIPTQHELTPRSSNQSFYFNPITFIMNMDAKLNEGKTHLIDDGLKRKCVKFFREAFESTLNRLAKDFVHTVPNTDPSPQTDLVIKAPIQIDGVDIVREPEDENTLITLFYQILKVKRIELPTYGLLSQGIFDGKFVYEDRNIRSDNDLKSLEFKVKLSKLLNDFDSSNVAKEFASCDLIIVWDADMTNLQQQDWRIVRADVAPTSNLRQSGAPDWADNLLRNKDNVYRPIIIVREWVEELDSGFRN